MTPQEARLILQCRRPHGQDDHLPAMAEARQALADHPDILSDCQEGAAFDALIGEKLRSCAVPEGLRDCIHAGARVTARPPWWKRRSGLGLGIAAVVAAGVFLTQYKPAPRPRGPDRIPVTSGSQELAVTNPAATTPAAAATTPGATTPAESATLPDFRQAVTDKVSQARIELAMLSNNSGDLQSYLAGHSKIRHVPIPAGLSPSPTHGCEVFQWRGREVTLICFQTDAGIAHLFTIDAADLAGDLPEPLCAHCNGWQTLTWKQDGKILLLTAQTSPEALRKIALPG
ncbi:MAG: hypothetical protein JWL81_1950 [Verrucomicrobiales bacterium]|nr:hypothetical protein [Verrucomicrobiales bacterium]